MCGKTRAHFCRSVYKYGSRTSLFRWSWLLHWWHWLIAINTAHKIGQWIGQACVIPCIRNKAPDVVHVCEIDYPGVKISTPSRHALAPLHSHCTHACQATHTNHTFSKCINMPLTMLSVCVEGRAGVEGATHMFGEQAAGGRRKFANFVSGST